MKAKPGPKRKYHSDRPREEVTLERVHGYLVRAIVNPNQKKPGKGDERVGLITRDLVAMQRMVQLDESDGWTGKRERRIEFKQAIAALKRSVPKMVQDLLRTRAQAEELADNDACGEIDRGLRLLTGLAYAAGSAERFSMLKNIEADRPAERLGWEHYADQIFRTLDTHLPEIADEEKYRFVEAFAADLTGEKLTRETIRSAIRDQRIVKWGDLPA